MPELFSLTTSQSQALAEMLRAWPAIRAMLGAGGTRFPRTPRSSSDDSGTPWNWKGKIISAASNPETYLAKTLYGPGAALSGALGESNLGTLSPEIDTIFYNMEAVGGSTYTLTENGETPYAIGFIYQTANGKQIVHGFSMLSEDCNTEEPASPIFSPFF